MPCKFSCKTYKWVDIRGKTNPPKPGSIRIRRGSVRIFEDPVDPRIQKKKKIASSGGTCAVQSAPICALRPRTPAPAPCRCAINCDECNALALMQRGSAMIHVLGRARGKLVHPVVAESSEQQAESFDDLLACLAENTLRNRWLTLKVLVRLLLRFVLACVRFWYRYFVSAKGNLSAAFGEKGLSTREERRAA